MCLDTSDWIALCSAVFALLAVFVSIYIYLKQAKIDLLNVQKMITDRLYELDRLALDNPDLELRLAELANRDSKEYFFSEVNVLNKDFIKLKLYIHYHINVMDEIVNVFEDNKNIRHSLEYGSWKLYILLTMKHPLFQEVYNSCSDIWGDRLNKFLNREGVAVEDQIKLNALYNNPRNV